VFSGRANSCSVFHIAADHKIKINKRKRPSAEIVLQIFISETILLETQSNKFFGFKTICPLKHNTIKKYPKCSSSYFFQPSLLHLPLLKLLAPNARTKEYLVLGRFNLNGSNVCLKMLLVKLLPLKTKLPMMLRNVFVV
jgi:hypothetical protein